jgi:hypothetical protein
MPAVRPRRGQESRAERGGYSIGIVCEEANSDHTLLNRVIRHTVQRCALPAWDGMRGRGFDGASFEPTQTACLHRAAQVPLRAAQGGKGELPESRAVRPAGGV